MCCYATLRTKQQISDWNSQPARNIGFSSRLRKASLLLESTLQSPAPQYGHPPPPYDDALNDLPPEYATVAPFASQTDILQPPAPERTTKKTRLVDPAHDVVIDWENPTGVREHKKKKQPANTKKAAPAPQSAANNADSGDKPDEDADEGDGGGDGGDGGGGGDDGAGGGGDDGDGDGWDDWTTPASKKKDKKKKKEEEEQKAKEEEEAKAAAGNNNLSWADEVDGNGDESWAGFATAGKKKKKGKVWFCPPIPLSCF
jgi:hypothetical protein